jgi:glycosyltransferase involved in cell wall biosynthesis
LQQIYSTWPWARLKREGLPHSKVQTFPWVHMAELASQRFLPGWRWGFDQFGYANALLFDEWLDRRLPKEAETSPEALIAISGAGLKTGRRLQQRGGIFICDRGSSHQRYQEQLVREEYRRWGVETAVSDIRDTVREEAIYEAADAITVLSTFAAKSFIESGVSKEKLHVMPLGVRLEKFQPTGPPDAERFDVLFAGQVNLRKGVPYLLEAFAQVRHPKKRLRFAGPVQPELQALLHRFPQGQVEFLGSRPQPELARYMSSSHVLVLPSIEDGFGMVMNQAMACGCPVIATDHCGSLDLLTEGEDGFIVPIRDVEALRDRMQRLVDDTSLQRTMRENAMRNVRRMGGWEQYGDLWESLLKKLIG